jgi:hypothetical protein
MMLQDEITAILSNTSLTQAEQAALLSALITPVAVTPAPQSLTVAAPPSVGGVAVRIDAVIPTGTPSTITLPVTGHVLSLPLQSQGEGILGYFQRTSLQTGGNAQDAGGLIVAATDLAHRLSMDAANASSWPYIVDWYANPVAYMNVYEPGAIAAGQAQDAKIALEDAGKGSVSINSIPVTDLQYAASVTQGNFSKFLVAYTNADHNTIDQAVEAYVAGGPQSYIGVQGLVGSPTIVAAVAAYEAASVTQPK